MADTADAVQNISLNRGEGPIPMLCRRVSKVGSITRNDRAGAMLNPPKSSRNIATGVDASKPTQW